MIELLNDPNVWLAFATLTVMEIVLGIDNIVFISIVVSKLPPEQAKRARQIGLALALVFRIALLSVLTWIIALKTPVFTIFNHGVSWRDIILIIGGLFLLYKATAEIHDAIEGETHEEEAGRKSGGSFNFIIGQIIVIDMIFSVDSIITAVGMAEHIEVMVAAVIVAVAVMYIASGPISDFVHRHPTVKMLALSFLLLIGVSLVADGFGFHIPRGYIYFAMAFSAIVEVFNIAVRRRRDRARAARGA
jgi:predicted tellurium resistance membrane protein TerC